MNVCCSTVWSVAADVNFGFLGGLTGPVSAIAAPMADAAQLALRHVNEQGGIHGGDDAILSIANSGCGNQEKAFKAIENLVAGENVVAIIGGICSGTTLAVAQSFAIPTGRAMISPASVSPSISLLKDEDLVFRTVVSGGYSAEVFARLLVREGLENPIIVDIADPQSGLQHSTVIKKLLKENGLENIQVITVDPAEDDIDAKIAEVKKLEPISVIIAGSYGRGDRFFEKLVKSDIAFKYFVFEGVLSRKSVSPASNRELPTITTAASELPVGPGIDIFRDLASLTGLDPELPFVANAYDAAFILALAHELRGDNEDASLARYIRDVSTAPGVKIFPGEWSEAIKAIADGKDINYEGAAGSHEFDENGDVAGLVRKAVIKQGKIDLLEVLR